MPGLLKAPVRPRPTGRCREQRTFAWICVAVACLAGCGRGPTGHAGGRIRAAADAAREHAVGVVAAFSSARDELAEKVFIHGEWRSTISYVGSTIDPATAHRLGGNEFGVFFPDLESLDSAAATGLGRGEGFLRFTRLTRINAATAAGFARHRGPLFLDAVLMNDAETARHLAGNAGWLSLNGLVAIDAEIAAALAAHEGLLSLNGLTTLPPEAAEPLARHRGDLCLNGLAAMSAATATHLARLRHALSMNRLVTLDNEAATALGGHTGWHLSLDGLTDLSAAAVAAIERHPRELSMRGIWSKPKAKLPDAAR